MVLRHYGGGSRSVSIAVPTRGAGTAVVTIMVSDGQTTVSVTITVIAGGNGNDWNEQGAIVEYLGRTRFVDAVGRVAVPDGVGSWCTLIRTVPQRCQLVASTPVASHVSSRP